MKRILLPVVMVIAGYYALFGGEYTLFELRRIHADRDRLQEEVAEARVELRVLQARADSLEHDPATLERLARERFGLIREGEILYRFAEPLEGGERRDDEGEGSG